MCELCVGVSGVEGSEVGWRDVLEGLLGGEVEGFVD